MIEEEFVTGHRSVLPAEVLEWLKVNPSGCYVDGTLGGGGHAELILERLEKTGRYVGIDRDPEALGRSRERLKAFASQIDFVHGAYADFEQHLKKLKIESIDGILLDLGVSSFQLDESSRGFSFLRSGPLDMRMNPQNDEEQSAADLVNTLSEQELEGILKQFGEERFSRRIARAVVEFRREEPFHNTKQLADLVWRVVPPFYRHGKIHPATRTFQGLRIAVNEELGQLERFLKSDFECLKPGGRILIITFHSLEDRLAKHAFKNRIGFRPLTKKPILPSPEEMAENPRSRSAKLRVIEKVDPATAGKFEKKKKIWNG